MRAAANVDASTLGRELLAAAERAARDSWLSLLFLDTQTGSSAERLYLAAGWTPVGVVPDYAADPARPKAAAARAGGSPGGGVERRRS